VRANFGHESPKLLWIPNFIWRTYAAPNYFWVLCVSFFYLEVQGIFDWLTDSFMKLLVLQAFGFKFGGS
jgi:hypothetical protein